DLARRVAGAAHLDLDVLGLHEHRLAPALAAGTADRDLALGLDAVVGVPRQVESPRHPREDVRPAAELPRPALPVDPGAARERHERDLAVAARGLERPPADAEEEIPPAGRLRRHLLPGAAAEEQLAHGCSRPPWNRRVRCGHVPVSDTVTEASRIA